MLKKQLLRPKLRPAYAAACGFLAHMLLTVVTMVTGIAVAAGVMFGLHEVCKAPPVPPQAQHYSGLIKNSGSIVNYTTGYYDTVREYHVSCAPVGGRCVYVDVTP